MFGNPQISDTPVDDLYSSQADLYGNSFYNPVNPANMNPGWGIDPSLLTPSYTAQYRPGYSGSNGATEYNRSGFFSSVNQLAPWTSTPMWGNPSIHNQDSVDSVASRPTDAAMWGVQRIGMPVAALWGAGKLMGGTNAFGMAKGASAAGKAFGRGLGGGIARGMGLGSGMAAKGMAGVLGGVGSIAAGYGLPLLAMQGIAEGAERAVFNPYINTRRSSEELRTNFNGITFGDSSGNVLTGGGLGSRESTDIASQITSQGIHDMNLSTGEYAEAASLVSRSGLMDNVNSKDISKRVKDSIEQVKLIMSVASMPELRDAIEQLSKFQKMGANVSGGMFSDAAGTMRQMGSLASVAGTNVQKLMNTVGAQGQYLYQANGMTPHLGQLAAANSYSALSAGNRMGLISSAQLARMGGLEGATQASLTGQINASQTLYNKLSNYNTYMGKGTQGSMLGNIAQFGQTMAADPMGVYGGMILNGRQMAGRQLQEKGSLAAEDQVWQVMKDQPGMIDRKTGKVSIERATPFLMQQGWNEDQIQAFAAQRIAETDKGTYDLSIKAMNKTLKEQQMQYVEQNTLYAGVMGRTAYSAMKGGRKLTDRFSQGLAQPIAGLVGDAGDTTQNLWYKAWYGDTIKSRNLTVEDALAGKETSKEGVNGFDLSKIPNLSRNEGIEDLNEYTSNLLAKDKNDRTKLKTSPAYGITVSPTHPEYKEFKKSSDQLNGLLDKSDPDAISFIKAVNPVDKQKALEVLKTKAKLDPEAISYLSNPLNVKKVDAELSIQGNGSKDTPDTKALKTSTQKIKDLKGKLDADTLSLLKAKDPEARSKAIEVLQSKNKIDKTTAEYLSTEGNVDKVEKALSKSANGSFDLIAKDTSNTPREVKYQVREMATKLNSLKDSGDTNAITYFKDPNSKEGKAALNTLIGQKKFSTETIDYLRNADNFKAATTALSAAPKTDKPTKEHTPDNIFARAYNLASLAMGVKEKPEKVESFRNTLTKVGGLEKEDVGVNLRVAGLSLEAASKVVDGETLAPNNIEKRLSSDKSLQQISKITGITDPQKLMSYIDKTSGAVADNKLVRLSVGAINVDSRLKGDDLVKAASAKVGGGVFDEAAIETKHLDQPEKLKATAATQEDARMRMDLNNKLKAGHIDFSGYQATMNAIDTKASVEKFDKAVDKFVSATGDKGSTPSNSVWNKMFGSSNTNTPSSLPSSGGVKDMNKSSGN